MATYSVHGLILMIDVILIKPTCFGRQRPCFALTVVLLSAWMIWLKHQPASKDAVLISLAPGRRHQLVREANAHHVIHAGSMVLRRWYTTSVSTYCCRPLQKCMLPAAAHSTPQATQLRHVHPPQQPPPSPFPPLPTPFTSLLPGLT